MRQLLPALLFVSAFWLLSAPAHAQKQLQCTINSVHDGDSMRVLCPGERGTLRVRMQQIDAPELEQAHGLRSRDYLRKLCRTGSTALIITSGSDQYGRMLGDVYCDGKSVNEEMVASGSAWVYNRYVKDRSLYRLQDQAKADRNGLWARRNPQAPWQWRYEQNNRN
ncbi:MAG: thermonuclease family protein [Alcaligenaceae bacterium]|nr:thermonuclease family protein [Alcaligenaceae bacterium]